MVAIRHVVRPSLSVNYKPDLSSKYFKTVQVDSTGYTARFSELQGGIFSGYSEGKSGGLSFQLDNNLEMKVRNKKDSTGENPTKKIRLIEGFGLSTSYNFLADSMKLSPIQFYFRTNLFEKININANASMSPYQTDNRGRDISKYAWEGGGKPSLGRLTSGSISMSTSFQSKPRDEAKDKAKKENMDRELNDPVLAADRETTDGVYAAESCGVC